MYHMYLMMQYSQKAFRNLESEFLFISAVKYMRLNTFEDLKQKHYGQTDGRTDGWTDPRIEMRGRI